MADCNQKCMDLWLQLLCGVPLTIKISHVGHHIFWNNFRILLAPLILTLILILTIILTLTLINPNPYPNPNFNPNPNPKIGRVRGLF